MSDPVRSYSIRTISSGKFERHNDIVAVEEPLDIRISYCFKDARLTQSLALAMRTPGSDAELAVGLLLSEGLIANKKDLIAVRELGTGESNEIMVEIAPEVDVESWRIRRNTLLSSSCGICGKVSRNAIAEIPTRRDDQYSVSADLLNSIPARMREHQRGFQQTGGLHAAALVGMDGAVHAVFEDIGRHNALDKLFGWCLLRDDLPIANRIIFLSSRSSFELVQKTAMAGGTMIATVGGPSSLAIETARSLGLTLAGFVRDGRCNVYSGEWRIDSK